MEDRPTTHICGLCKNSWPTEAEYIAHQCPSTGYTPADPLHLGPEFAAVSEAALARGAERAAAEPSQTSGLPIAQ